MTTKFSGVLLKPLDQQADYDGTHIDPAGVKFDPNEVHTIWRNFSYNVPDDVLGWGRVHRAEDGALLVAGELNEKVPFPKDEPVPWRLAIGVSADKLETPIARHCSLMSIAITANHADPTQPPVVVGINRRDQMNLVRLGHYFNPGSDSCQTALVVKVVKQGATDSVVNLKVWDGDGDDTKRLDVPENTGPTIDDTEASFHLSTNCPWGR